MIFRWNQKRNPVTSVFWDVDKNDTTILTHEKTDAEMVKNPGGHEIREVVEAMARVMAEMIELKEGEANE